MSSETTDETPEDRVARYLRRSEEMLEDAYLRPDSEAAGKLVQIAETWVRMAEVTADSSIT